MFQQRPAATPGEASPPPTRTLATLCHTLTQVWLPSYLFFVLLQGLYRDNTELIVSVTIRRGGCVHSPVTKTKPLETPQGHLSRCCSGKTQIHVRICHLPVLRTRHPEVCSQVSTRAQSLSNCDPPVTGTGQMFDNREA